MKFNYNKNIMMLDGKRLVFDYDISSVLTFPNYIVVLLSAPAYSYDEVYAINSKGKIVWNIADIMPYDVPEIYTQIKKDLSEDNLLIVYTYSGMKLWINTTTNEVVKKLLVR